jgi:hypothetical protein
MSYYIRPDGTVGGGMQNPLDRQKELEKTKEVLNPNSKDNSSLFKIVLLGVVAYVIYKFVKK